MPSVTADTTVEATVDFEVYCAKCGAGICGNCTEGRTTRRSMPYIQVSPCETCLEAARDEGREEAEAMLE